MQKSGPNKLYSARRQVRSGAWTQKMHAPFAGDASLCYIESVNYAHLRV